MAIVDMSMLNSPVQMPKSLDTIKTVAEDADVSFFCDTVNFLIENGHLYNGAVATLYTSLSESADVEAIHESFSDFKNTVKKIIDKFIAFIKSLFERFINLMNRIVKSEKYLKNHIKDLNSFGSNHEFDFDGYTYTFSDNIPITDPQSEWLKDIDLAFSAYADAANATDGDNIAKSKAVEEKMREVIKNVKEELSNGDYFDRMRATVIGREGESIGSTEYDGILFKIFRNNDSDKSNITVNKEYVHDIADRFKGYESFKKDIERNRNEIEAGYKAIKTELERISTKDGDTMTLALATHANASSNYGTATIPYSKTTQTLSEQYKKIKIDQVAGLADIHALAFAAKLDAAKEMFMQDKTVLYKALYRVQGLKPAEPEED